MARRIANTKRARRLALEEVENSIILYLSPNGIVSSRDYNKKGSKEGVAFPDITEVIEGCKRNRTNKVVLIHNHPPVNGWINTNPSLGDIKGTILFRQVLLDHGIVLKDHIILSPLGYFSFQESHLL
jgi:DNA repair protein RadC